MPLGLKVPVKWMADLIGAPEVKAGEQVLEQSEPPALPAAAPAGVSQPPKKTKARRPALHSANAEQSKLPPDPVDAVALRAERMASAALDAIIDRIRSMIDSADTLDSLRDGLAEMTGRAEDEADLAASLRQALAFVELTSRSDLDDGA